MQDRPKEKENSVSEDKKYSLIRPSEKVVYNKVYRTNKLTITKGTGTTTLHHTTLTVLALLYLVRMTSVIEFRAIEEVAYML